MLSLGAVVLLHLALIALLLAHSGRVAALLPSLAPVEVLRPEMHTPPPPPIQPLLPPPMQMPVPIPRDRGGIPAARREQCAAGDRAHRTIRAAGAAIRRGVR